MTRRSLKALLALSRNTDLASFVQEIEYVAFDFAPSICDKVAFRDYMERSVKEATPRWNKLSEMKHDIIFEREYMDYTSYLLEHQHMIRERSDRRTLYQVFSAFSNVREIKFTRLAEWADFKCKFKSYGKSSIDYDYCKAQDVTCFKDGPVHWRGFFGLADVASKTASINTVTFDGVVLDLASSKATNPRALTQILKNTTSLKLLCSSQNYRSISAHTQWDEYHRSIREAKSWHSVLTSASQLTSLEFGRTPGSDWLCDDLLTQVLKVSNWPALRRFSLVECPMRIEDLSEFLLRHKNSLRHVHFEQLTQPGQDIESDWLVELSSMKTNLDLTSAEFGLRLHPCSTVLQELIREFKICGFPPGEACETGVLEMLNSYRRVDFGPYLLDTPLSECLLVSFSSNGMSRFSVDHVSPAERTPEVVERMAWHWEQNFW